MWRLPQQVPRGNQEIRPAFAVLLLLLLTRPAAAANHDAVARGAYLAAAAGCDQCHTDSERGGQSYAGGRRLHTPFGIVTTPNLTPDRATGIGRWSKGDLVRAIRWGVAPDDSHYLSVFPFLFYNRLAEADLDDIAAFLASLPAVPHPGIDGASSPAPLARARAQISVFATPLPGPWHPDTPHDATWNRGAYLVATVGRCGDCHTPRTRLGAPDPTRFLAGMGRGADGKAAPNITPDRKGGIGDWSRDDIVGVLTDGHTPDFDFVGGAMGEIVKNTSRLTADDRQAIAAYLKSVAPVSTPERK